VRPLFHPQLVNGAIGDPCLFVEYLFERRALLFDIGTISGLSGRRLLRVSDVFVTHAHMDHFIGFDHMVRTCLGRNTELRLFGPPRLIGQVEHHLQGYSWNLVENYQTDFAVTVTEIHAPDHATRARFRCRNTFRREGDETVEMRGGVLLDEEAFSVRCAILDHQIPCLGFRLEERMHVNIWKNRLAERGLPVGPWLKALKSAVIRGESDETRIPVPAGLDDGKETSGSMPLGELRDVLRIVPGQKLAYITDVVYHEDNARRIVDLASDADLLFIEAPFLHRDVDRAASKYHLTARQAGSLACKAGARCIIPMHFSARYADDYSVIEKEARAAFESGSHPEA
jgi:ribonuclease Z